MIASLHEQNKKEGNISGFVNRARWVHMLVTVPALHHVPLSNRSVKCTLKCTLRDEAKRRVECISYSLSCP